MVAGVPVNMTSKTRNLGVTMDAKYLRTSGPTQAIGKCTRYFAFRLL